MCYSEVTSPGKILAVSGAFRDFLLPKELGEDAGQKDKVQNHFSQRSKKSIMSWTTEGWKNSREPCPAWRST